MIYQIDKFRETVEAEYKVEDIFCQRGYVSYNLNKVFCQYECFENLEAASKEFLFFLEKPEPLSNECWLALVCYLQIIKQINNSHCINICQEHSCKKIIDAKCPEIFFLPNAPIAFGHIYLAYTKAYLINQTNLLIRSRYFCYNEQLCAGFEPKRTFISFNNTICRRMADYLPQYSITPTEQSSICYYINLIRQYLSQCNTILPNELVMMSSDICGMEIVL